jgi:hypothetical protein
MVWRPFTHVPGAVMSQPPYPPYSPQPHPGGDGTQGYPPPGIPQQPAGYAPPPPPQYAVPPQYDAGSGQYRSSAQYAPQQYGTPPQYGAPAPFQAPPKKKSSVLKIVLITFTVIALLCVAGVGVTFFVARDKVSQLFDATKISVVEPATLGGREQISEPAIQASVAQLDTELSKVPGSTGSVAAAYGDVKKQDLVMVAAASSLSGSAESRFEEFTSGMDKGGMQVSNLTDTDPGPLGGIAKCGDTGTSGVPMAICVWSDNGSIGMFAMLFKQKADLEKEFVALRGEVERRK